MEENIIISSEIIKLEIFEKTPKIFWKKYIYKKYIYIFWGCLLKGEIRNSWDKTEIFSGILKKEMYQKYNKIFFWDYEYLNFHQTTCNIFE